MNATGKSRVGDYILDGELPAAPGERAFAATHVLLPRRARIVMPARTSRGLAARLVREACVLEAVRHAGVPRVFETGLMTDRRPWIAMELVDAPSVADRIVDWPLAAIDVVCVLRDVAQILHHAHGHGVVHANVSATAIAMRATGDGGICLLDWGSARLPDSPAPTGVFRDRVYRAPEQELGAALDGSADIYALGVVAYEALSRGLPTMSAARRCPGAPAALTSLIDRMLARDPATRPSAAEVRAEAIGLFELFYIPELEPDDQSTLETIDVDLVQLDDMVDVPAMPNRSIAWTPALGFEATVLPGKPLAMIVPTRRRA